MKFSILHPSRWRSTMSYKCFETWMGNASSENEYEYLLSIDEDDNQLENYKHLFKNTGIKLIINNNRSIVDAVNIAASHATGDILIVVSDDFGCPENWDIEILQLILSTSIPPDRIMVEGDGVYLLPQAKFAIQIDDCLTKKGTECMTLPIISKSVYQKLGHIYNPVYFSMFADQELYDVCKMNGWLIHSDLKFPHNHYTNGKNKVDETYLRENASKHYLTGQKIYLERKTKNFQP